MSFDVFDVIGLGVWVIAACHLTDRLPARKMWGWLRDRWDALVLRFLYPGRK